MIEMSRRQLLVITAATLIVIGTYVGIGLMDHALRGNRRFVFYGKVVDETGKPMNGVIINAEVKYSTSIRLPIAFAPRRKSSKPISATNNSQGEFQLHGNGYYLTINGFRYEGKIYDRKYDAPLNMNYEIPTSPRNPINRSLQSPMIYVLEPD